MSQLTSQEVADHLRKAIRGGVEFKLHNPEWTWNRVYAGVCVFIVGDWEIAFFNDCDELDYVEEAVAPDGRRATFNELWEASGQMDAIDLLTDEELGTLESMCEDAT